MIQFFSKPLFKERKFWLRFIGLLTVILCAHQLLIYFYSGDPNRVNGGSNFLNNYMIFRTVFWSAVEQTNLYLDHPSIHYDHNHYGPVFSVVIAPFALLPKFVGMVFWPIMINLLFIWTVWKLELLDKQKALIVLITLNAIITCTQDNQSNALIAIIVILTFVFAKKEKIYLATFLIMLGTFIKIYGIVGVVFFLFTKHKFKFIIGLIGSAVILYILPMPFFGFEYINQSYIDWYTALSVKTGTNQLSPYQNISVIGAFYKLGLLWFGESVLKVSTLALLLPIVALLGISMLNFKAYQSKRYQFNLLALMLMCVILFSSGTEVPTYIIGIAGVGIWFISKKSRTLFEKILFWVCFVFCIMAPSDLFPKFIYRAYMQPYAVIALPCFAIWLYIIYEQIVMKVEAVSEN